MKFEAVMKQLESQQMEVMEARLMKTSELSGELEDDSEAGQCSCGLLAVAEEYRQRCCPRKALQFNVV